MRDALEELLRRCHAAELQPLAEVLDIRFEQLGLHQLSRAIAVTLRRRGAQDLVNIVKRKGQGPPYVEVVSHLAQRRGVDPDQPLEVVERQLLEAWLREAWKRLDPSERDRLWGRLQLESPAPAGPEYPLVPLSSVSPSPPRSGRRRWE